MWFHSPPDGSRDPKQPTAWSWYAPWCALSARRVRSVAHSVSERPPNGPGTAPTEARALRDGRRWGPVAVSWDGIRSGNVWGAFSSWFCPSLPCQRCVVSLGPETAPNGGQWPTGGLVAVSGDGTHLGNVRAARWSCFARFSLLNGGCVLRPQDSPKTVRKRPKLSFSKKRPSTIRGAQRHVFGLFRPRFGPF